MVLNEVFSVCVRLCAYTPVCIQAPVCCRCTRSELKKRDMHRLAFEYLLKVVVHGVNFHVGHLFCGGVVVAMLELWHCLWIRTIMALNEPLVTSTSAHE